MGGLATEKKNSSMVLEAVLRVLLLPLLLLLAPVAKFLLYALHERRRLRPAEKKLLLNAALAEEVWVVEAPSALMRLFFGPAEACAVDATIYVFEAEGRRNVRAWKPPTPCPARERRRRAWP